MNVRLIFILILAASGIIFVLTNRASNASKLEAQINTIKLSYEDEIAELETGIEKIETYLGSSAFDDFDERAQCRRVLAKLKGQLIGAEGRLKRLKNQTFASTYAMQTVEDALPVEVPQNCVAPG